MDNSLDRKRRLVQSLIRDVQTDIKEYGQLKTMLKHQKELMNRTDNEQLEVHNNHQTQLCYKLAERANKRSDELKQLGFDHDEKGMLKLINALPVRLKPQVKIAWGDLRNLALECQKQNEENGKLLAMQHDSIQDILRATAGDPEQIDYGTPVLG